MSALLLPAPGQARPHRGVHPGPRGRVARDGPGARRHGLAQLLALPARRTDCSSATSRAPTWPPPSAPWPPPRSTPGGRPRWATSSRTWTSLPTRGSCSSTRSSTSRTSSPADHHHPHPDHEGSVMTVFADIATALEGLAIEVPSWAYGNSGTRFKVFGSPGTPRTVQEKIADAATVHRFTGLAPTVALHIPWDKVEDYADLSAYAKEHGVALGTDQLQHLPGRRLQARQPDQRRRGDPPQGDRPQPRVHRDHEQDGLARPEGLARRRHQLPRPGRHPRPPGLARRGTRRDLRAALGGPAAGAGVQVLRAGVLPHRRPRLGHVVRPLHGPRRARHGVPRHRPPRAREPTSSSSWRSCCASAGSAPSTSTAASTPTTT